MSDNEKEQTTYRKQLAALFEPRNAAIRTEKDTNAGLWLDRYIVNQSRTNPQRSTLINQVAALSTSGAYQAFYQRWEQTLKSYGVTREQKRLARTNGRMIIGLGDESVLETSVALHHTYGVPYIPGSALKGLAANYARLRLGPQWKKDQEGYKVVFGNTDEAGFITFFDALYIPESGHDKKALHPDVITVHHPLYYRSEKEATPSDWDSPTPIPFLSATGKYLVALAAPDLDPQVKLMWLATTFRILEHALAELGIGAKTSSGYGRMILEPPLVDPEMRKAESYQQEIAALKNVAAEIPAYHQKWQKLTSDEARTLVARAIIEKVRQVGYEKNSAGKAWYKELLVSLVSVPSSGS